MFPFAICNFRFAWMCCAVVLCCVLLTCQCVENVFCFHLIKSNSNGRENRSTDSIIKISTLLSNKSAIIPVHWISKTNSLSSYQCLEILDDTYTVRLKISMNEHLFGLINTTTKTFQMNQSSSAIVADTTGRKGANTGEWMNTKKKLFYKLYSNLSGCVHFDFVSRTLCQCYAGGWFSFQ